MKITIQVSVGDRLSDLCNALKALDLPGVKARIRKQCQVNDIWTHSGACVCPFEGSTEEVVAYLEDRCHAATGYPNSTHRADFALSTVVEIWK